MLGTPENPPLLARKVRAVRTREVRTISRKDHVRAAAVSDDYLYGLIDGEGMFHVGIVPSTFTRLGWQVIYQFKVAQNPVGEPVLRALQERLGCGTISPNARAGARDRTLSTSLEISKASWRRLFLSARADSSSNVSPSKASRTYCT